MFPLTSSRKMDYWELKNLPRPVVPENHSQKNAQARVHLPTFRAITTDLKSGQWIDSIIWDDSKPSKAPLPTGRVYRVIKSHLRFDA